MGAIATVHVDNGLPVGEGGNDAPPADEAAANMRYIAAFNPQVAIALLDRAQAVEARSTALEAERDAEKARADAAEAERDKVLDDSYEVVKTKREHEATISTLTAERDALKRERDEARAAHDGWNPIATCPIREPVDLWCVYGGEEFAQYEGGASIGKLVPNRIKTKEYGFFGNQSDNGVPQRDAPDLVPVAWRKAVPSCPAIVITEALHIPITLEDARAVLARTGEPTDE